MGIFRESFFRVFGILFLSVVVFSCQNKTEKRAKEDVVVPDTLVPLEPVLKYGIPVDSFSLVEGVIRSDQYLSEILNNNGVGMVTIDKLARKSKPVFDVRKIRSKLLSRGFTFRNIQFFKLPTRCRKPVILCMKIPLLNILSMNCLIPSGFTVGKKRLLHTGGQHRG